MPRAVWSGVVSFGMVAIPVKLYSATESTAIAFNLLHEKCHGRIQEKRFCPQCEQEVAYGELVKGYQYSKDEYVIVTPKDLENLPLPSKNVVEVSSFVHIDEIDPVYFDRSYYLEPDKLAKKPYALLLQSLAEKSIVAIGKIALRQKERLCVLRPYGGLLMLETLLFPDEVTVEKSTNMSDVEPSKQERTMAGKLIDLMIQPFKPEDYKDSYRAALEEMVEAKLEEREVKPHVPVAKGKVIDLMDALRKSVASAETGSKPARHKRAANTKSKKRATSPSAKTKRKAVAKKVRRH